MRRDYSRVHRLSGCRYDAAIVADGTLLPIRLGDLYGRDTQEKSESTNKSRPSALAHGTPRCACLGAREVARFAQGRLETRACSEINGIGRLPSSTLPFVGIPRCGPLAPRLRFETSERVGDARLLGFDVETRRAQHAPPIEDDRLPRALRFGVIGDHLAALALGTRFHTSDLVHVAAAGQRRDAHRNLDAATVKRSTTAHTAGALPIHLRSLLTSTSRFTSLLPSLRRPLLPGRPLELCAYAIKQRRHQFLGALLQGALLYFRDGLTGILCNPVAAALRKRADIIALIIYTMTMEKLRHIAMLKLIGAPDRTIVGMIVQQALALGMTGFLLGALLIATIKDYFPRRVVLDLDNVLALGGVVVLVCLPASALGVRAALKADPATALGS